MNTLFVLNHRGDAVHTMTTTRLIDATLRRGHRTLVAGTADLSLDHAQRFHAFATELPTELAGDLDGICAHLLSAAPAELSSDEIDAVWTRMNPARDPRKNIHDAAIAILWEAERRGMPILNRPEVLHRAGNKRYVVQLPESVRPQTLIASREEPLRRFIEARDRAVLKPLSGTRGQGVFIVHPDNPNLSVILELLLAQGPVVAQSYAEGAELGDTRVVMVNGRPFTVDGRIAAVRRIPGGTDHRSNIHAGATAAPAELTPAQLSALELIGDTLARDGVWNAGVDLVGEVVLEVNVHATGGFRDATRFEDRDFSMALVEAFEAEVQRQITLH